MQVFNISPSRVFGQNRISKGNNGCWTNQVDDKLDPICRNCLLEREQGTLKQIYYYVVVLMLEETYYSCRPSTKETHDIQAGWGGIYCPWLAALALCDFEIFHQGFLAPMLM